MVLRRKSWNVETVLSTSTVSISQKTHPRARMSTAHPYQLISDKSASGAAYIAVDCAGLAVEVV